MKLFLNIQNNPTVLIRSLISCFLLLAIPVCLLAQTDTTAAPETIAPSIDFSSVQKGDNTIDLKTVVRAKYKGSFVKLYGLRIHFFAVSDSTEKEAGSVVTNSVGIAVLNVKADVAVASADGKLHFKAKFNGNKGMDAVEETVAFKRAAIIITPVKEDSVLSVTVKLADLSTGAEKPIGGTAIGVFVKRLFNPLKLGEVTPDSSTAEGSVEIPTGLPGDAKGNITLLAKVDDNEEYGNIESAIIQPWGTPVSHTEQEMPRALWSSHPPIWMLVTFVVLLVIVWGHYIVIVYELIRLRKEQPKAVI